MNKFHQSPTQSWREQDLGPDRVEPPCPYFGKCGGCQLQHMNEARQLIEKEKWVREIFQGMIPEEKIHSMIPSPKNWNYRRRVQFQISPDGEVGFYGWGSQKVVPIKECLIADERINAAIPMVQNKAAEFLSTNKKPAELSYEVTVQENEEVEIQRRGTDRQFLQVNPEANQMLQEFLHASLEKNPPRSVLELYAGSGNLTYALADEKISWTAVESNPLAVEEGRRKLGEKKDSIEWVLDSSAKFLKTKIKKLPSFDLVLLDPPREGAGEIIPYLLQLKTSKICYVSCHPLSLKRDLKKLLAGGYGVEEMQPIDFFPQTMQVELVVAIKR